MITVPAREPPTWSPARAHSAPRRAGHRAHFAPRRCRCGRLLIQAVRGRWRLTCSPACRRERDRLTRLARRRATWVEGWHRLAHDGTITPAEAARETHALADEITRLLRQAGRGEGGFISLEDARPKPCGQVRARFRRK